jgi:hypothetical protein
VGHVFRDKSPYTFPGGVAKIVLKNAARVAEVWLDEWREFYYAMSPGLALFFCFFYYFKLFFIILHFHVECVFVFCGHADMLLYLIFFCVV